MYTSCLYARGITPAFNADQTYVTNRFTSLVYDGHGSGYLCGYGSIYMNGAFVRPASIQIATGGGWFGDYSNEGVNILGALRQLVTHMRFVTRAYRGLNWLVISDKDSMTDVSNTGAWGQLLNFLDAEGFNTLRHTPQEIQSGAYGYDTRPEYFLQFSGVLLLMSGSTPMNNALSQAITDSITLGASVVVLQKNNSEGSAPVRTIINPLGIEHGAQAYLYTNEQAVTNSISALKDHVAWTNVSKLHNQFTRVLSATYTIRAAGKGTVTNVAGQPGTWEAFICLDIPDETDIRDPIFYRENCCVSPGDAYEAEFTAQVFPVMPENWGWAFGEKFLKVDWTSDNALPLADRALIRFRVAGTGSGVGTSIFWDKNKAQTVLGQGYTVIRLDASLAEIERSTFNTAQGGQGSPAGVQAAQAMAQYITDIPSGDHVIVVSFGDAATNHMVTGLPAAMYTLGASKLTFGASWFRHGAAYLLFGTKGISEGTATIEMYYKPQPIDDVVPPTVFMTGFNLTDEGVTYCCGTEDISRNTIDIEEMITNGLYARLKYFKELAGVDGSKKYGIKHTTKMYDTRFKKLPVFDTKNTVVSVENPCIPPYRVGDWDWVRVWHASARTESVVYEFKDQHEYVAVFILSDGRTTTQSFMMDYETYRPINYMSDTCLIIRGVGTDMYLTLDYSRTGAGSGLLQVYERRATFVNRAVEPDTNEFEIFAPYSTSRRNIELDPGYEYFVFTADEYGVQEYVSQKIVLLPDSLIQRWPGPKYIGSQNSSVFVIEQTNVLRIVRGNTLNKIVRRPFVSAVSTEDRFGWQLAYHNTSPTAPQTPSIPFVREEGMEYIVIGACNIAAGGTVQHSMFTWPRVNELRGGNLWTGPLVGFDQGCSVIEWTYDGKTVLPRQGLQWISSIGWEWGAYGIFMILKRPSVSWEPYEVIGGD